MFSARDRYLVLLAAFLGWMFDGLEMGIFPQIAALGARAARRRGRARTRSSGGTASSTPCFLFGAACGGLVFGWLGDRIGRVRAMAFAILVYSGFTGLLYFVNSPEQIAALRFIAALGMGGEWALGVALVMEVWDAKHRPLLAGLIGAAANVGFVLVGRDRRGDQGRPDQLADRRHRRALPGAADVHHPPVRPRVAQVAGDAEGRPEQAADASCSPTGAVARTALVAIVVRVGRAARHVGRGAEDPGVGRRSLPGKTARRRGQLADGARASARSSAA